MKLINILSLLALTSLISCSSINIIKNEKASKRSHISSKRKNKIRKKIRKRKSIVKKKSLIVNHSKIAPLSLSYSRVSYKSWLKYFQTRSKKRFARYIKRGEKFKKTIKKIFRSHGLPEDLYYVGLIESGYTLNSKSHASAVGPWQFMKKTGIHYGLKVNSRIDERVDIVKSTHAAARYFKDLYNIFGSWELALCGYNAGEYRVIRAIRKGKSRNYISLSNKGLIPKETSNYVPKVAAARQAYYNFFKRPALAKTQVRAKNKKNKKKKSSNVHKVRRGDTLYSISRKHNTSIRRIKKMNKIAGSNIYIGQKIFLAYSAIRRK